MEGSSDDNLRAFLVANGFEGAENLSREEMESIATALFDVQPSQFTDTAPRTPPHAPPVPSDEPTVTGYAGDGDAFMMDDSAVHDGALVFDSPAAELTAASPLPSPLLATAVEAENSVEGAAAEGSCDDEVNQENAIMAAEDTLQAGTTAAVSSEEASSETFKELLETFCGVTGCTDEDSARNFLETFGWDVETAISMFLEAPTSSQSTMRTTYSTTAGGGLPTPPQMHPFFRQNLNTVTTTSAGPARRMRRRRRGDGTGGQGGRRSQQGGRGSGAQDVDSTDGNVFDSEGNPVPPIPAATNEADQSGESADVDVVDNDGDVTADRAAPVDSGEADEAVDGSDEDGDYEYYEDDEEYEDDDQEERDPQDSLNAALRGMTLGETDHEALMRHFMRGAGLHSTYFPPPGYSRYYGGDDDGSSPRVDEYDEEGIRKPDPVKTQRLIGGGYGAYGGMSGAWFSGGPNSSYIGGSVGGGGRGSSSANDGNSGSNEIQNRIMSTMEEAHFARGRAEDPSVEWLFPPPEGLSHPGPLEHARAVANADGRWILTNIQSHQEFLSHTLNRDIWTDETIDSILRTSFLFWQRGSTSPDAMAYMQTYKLNEDDLPHIGIIDPRTGAKKLQLVGNLTAEELALRLVDFSDRNTLTSRAGSGAGSRSGSVGESTANSRHTSTDNLSEAGAASAEMAISALADEVAAPGSVESAITSSVAEQGKIGIADEVAESPCADLPDFGEIPEEPADGTGVRISIKLSNGKALVRKYHPNTPVRALFAVVLYADPAFTEQQQAVSLPVGKIGFDLVTRFPVMNLLEKLESTVEDCNLAGSQVLFRWIEK